MIRIILAVVLVYGLFCSPILFKQDFGQESHCALCIENGDMNKCEVCHVVIDAITYDVKKYNRTIHDITELTEDLCRDIGGEIIGKECAFIIDNIQKIIDWIQTGSSVDYICTKLNLCLY